ATTPITRVGLARLETNGKVDTTYNPNPNANVVAMVMQADGKLVIGGGFTAFLPNFGTTIVARNQIARINTDGTIDLAYDPDTNSQVSAMALQPDGKIVIGGLFQALRPNAADTVT